MRKDIWLYKRSFLIILLLSTSLLVVLLLSTSCLSTNKSVDRKEVGLKKIEDNTEEKKGKNIINKKLEKSEVKDTIISLSEEAKILIETCNNYFQTVPSSPKIGEVLTIKASVYYKNGIYDSARASYLKIINEFPKSEYKIDAIKMIAQSYFEEKKFEEAQKWYKKLSEESLEGADKEEAILRIGESIFRLAELLERENKYKEAAEQYEKVAIEYPDLKIADIALFNAGTNYEKVNEWERAILVYQKLLSKYPSSKLIEKCMFKIAKCYEKQQQWELAGETYLKIAVAFPKGELTQTALYNAGFCFENLERFLEAAKIFEKMVIMFPSSEDAPDVLFHSAELYGKAKDWESVSRVTRLFSERFGNDEKRIIQAICMDGIALYMRNLNKDAIERLNYAVIIFTKIKNPGTLNTYYAAKALYTIGEIYHLEMNKITLQATGDLYRKKLQEKSNLLDRTIEYYGKVIKFNISEWTYRAIFQIGIAYEDFAAAIFSQERPPESSFDKRISLELGIAEAVERYFVEKALPLHEKNVKLSIQEKVEDKYILESRNKLTYLPYVAAENYLALVEIVNSTKSKGSLEGLPLIAQKLQILQKTAPFKKRAIELLLKALEMGSLYQEQKSPYYKMACSTITGISFSVGETYYEIVSIARDASIPSGFDEYERFVYKTKLLKQIEAYEEQALENYFKTIKIAEAYKISNDESVKKAQERIAQLLFTRGRCYDLLCINTFVKPPYPANINEAEKEEYRARFEEIGLKFQEQAFEIYRNILDLAKKSWAAGEYVRHSYVRLFQNFPDQYGIKDKKIVE
ncbi:MAG: tetratricopeptide repeat protein, partial [Chitinispirillaceae bacterium]|nr:tetratricopeptide repeat protein [Chitinispirillaceae bacterium]